MRRYHFAALAAASSALFSVSAPAVTDPQVLSGIVTSDGKFGMYLAFELSAGAEPKRPTNIQLKVSENYLAKFAGKARKSAKLVEVKNCQHSQKAFLKFNDGLFGGSGKNDFEDILPMAIECGDLSFLFLVYRDPAIAKSTAEAYMQRGAKRFDWRTQKLAAVWWASREQVIPLEDLSGIKDPLPQLNARLK